MLKQYSNQVKEKVNAHVLEYFTPDMYGNEAPAIENLKDQMKSLSHMTPYAAGYYMAEGGTFLVYYREQRDFLMETLEQDDEANDKYSNHQVFKTYCHMIGKAVERLVA